MAISTCSQYCGHSQGGKKTRKLRSPSTVEALVLLHGIFLVNNDVIETLRLFLDVNNGHTSQRKLKKIT